MAEVPGLEEKDIEVLLEDGVLTLRGEKKSETEDKDRQFSEHYYGRFERRGSGREMKQDKVAATFKNGVLKVTLPRRKGAGECQAHRDQQQQVNAGIGNKPGAFRRPATVTAAGRAADAISA